MRLTAWNQRDVGMFHDNSSLPHNQHLKKQARFQWDCSFHKFCERSAPGFGGNTCQRSEASESIWIGCPSRSSRRSVQQLSWDEGPLASSEPLRRRSRPRVPRCSGHGAAASISGRSLVKLKAACGNTVPGGRDLPSEIDPSGSAAHHFVSQQTPC